MKVIARATSPRTKARRLLKTKNETLDPILLGLRTSSSCISLSMLKVPICNLNLAQNCAAYRFQHWKKVSTICQWKFQAIHTGIFDRLEIALSLLVFVEGGKPENLVKNSRNKARNNSKLNPQSTGPESNPCHIGGWRAMLDPKRTRRGREPKSSGKAARRESEPALT